MTGERRPAAVFQKGRKVDLGNYRLVSCTLVPDKLWNKCLEAISSHIMGKTVKRVSKHGFTKGTCQTLSDVLERVELWLRREKQGCHLP